MFKTHPTPLQDLLKEIDDGQMQLPEFQRGWIWDDPHIRSLLASTLRGYPIGTIMRLEAGGRCKFQPRPLEGVKAKGNPTTFLLDGQQRMTSLYQALVYRKAVRTRDGRNKQALRWYYVDMKAMLSDPTYREELVISMPEDKIQRKGVGRTVRLDLSTRKGEFQHHMFPTGLLYHEDMNWFWDYIEYWTTEGREHPIQCPRDFSNNFNSTVIKAFQKYQLPVIDLDRNTSREGVCLVFEKVNTEGMVLTVFELLTAILAAEGFDLRKDWEDREQRMHQTFPVLEGMTSVHFLQAVTLLSTWNRSIERGGRHTASCTRQDILNLTRSEYERWADAAEKGFQQAARFLSSLCIYQSRDLPYTAQLVSLATLCAVMGRELETADARTFLARWYWTGVFAEDYAGAPDSRLVQDLQQIPPWIQTRGQRVSEVMEQAIFLPERLLQLRTRVSAAYKGLHALQMHTGARDWRTGDRISADRYFDERIDIHHIFPHKWCDGEGGRRHLGTPIPRQLANSAINKAPLSASTNRKIGGRAPSCYLEDLRQDNRQVEADLHKSDIDVEVLKQDDFSTFFIRRGMALMAKISVAMGRDMSDGQQVFQEALDEARRNSQGKTGT